MTVGSKGRPGATPSAAPREAAEPGSAPIGSAADGSAAREVWLFGYGSLIWRPELEHTAHEPAVLPGHARRFWQRSTDHRGTEDFPGRVVTVVPAAGARVAGVAFRLADPAPTLARIDHREQQGYQRRELIVHTRGGPRRALVYVADPHNPYFAGDEPPARSAEVIARARGPSGDNLEYARALVAALETLGRTLALTEDELAYEREVLARAEELARSR